MKQWLTRLVNRKKRGAHSVRFKGGVDAGRQVFAKVDDQSYQQKKSLLRTLNLYWQRKKAVRASLYGEEPAERRTWKRPVLLLICLAAAAYLFVNNDGAVKLGRLVESITYFRIRAVDVEGCRNSVPGQVRAASGITINSNLFSITADQVNTSVKAKNPWIKDVSVDREWPDRVVLKVSEYEPYALITLGSPSQAQLYYLDGEGAPFVQPEHGMDVDYPVITGLEAITENEQRQKQLEQPLQFLRLVGGNNPNLPAQSVSEVHIDPQEGMVIYLVEHPFPIFFGSGDIHQKYIRLRRILEVLYKPRKTGMDIARVAYIRMDYLPDKVIVGYNES